MRIAPGIFAILIAILAVLVLLAVALAVVSIIAEKIRQMLLKPGHDDQVGDYLFRNGSAEAIAFQIVAYSQCLNQPKASCGMVKSLSLHPV